MADAWGGAWGDAWGVSWGGDAVAAVLTGTGPAGIKRIVNLYSPYRLKEMTRRFREEAQEAARIAAMPAAETVAEAPKPKLTGTEYLASLGITPDLASLTADMRAQIDAEIEAMRLEARRQIEDDAAILLLLSQY